MFCYLCFSLLIALFILSSFVLTLLRIPSAVFSPLFPFSYIAFGKTIILNSLLSL